MTETQEIPPPPIDDTATPLSPEAFETGDKLSPSDIQTIREIIEKTRSIRKPHENFELPSKPITERDEEAFFASLMSRSLYKEEFTLVKKPEIKVCFRVLTTQEKLAIDKQLEDDFADQIIKSERTFAAAKVAYKMVLQIVSYNGVVQPNNSPAIISGQKTLRGAAKDHFTVSLPEPLAFIISGSLSQFDERVAIMSQKILTGNFCHPVIDT